MKFKARAVLELSLVLYKLDNAQPDVGMGPGLDSFVKDAAARLGLELRDFDYAEVAATFITENRHR